MSIRGIYPLDPEQCGNGAHFADLEWGEAEDTRVDLARIDHEHDVALEDLDPESFVP